MRTPGPGVTGIRLLVDAAGRGRGVHTAASAGCGRGASLARAEHHDEIRRRLSSGTYHTRAAVHALACALLARGEV